MTNIQKKSLQHISDTLKSFDEYTAYEAVNEAIKKTGISDDARNTIMGEYNKAIRRESRKIIQAKEWVDALISDIEK